MITPKEAEDLAHKAVEQYVNECHCDNMQDVANVVMKLASMCGLVMCATVGQDEAVSRLQGTTDHIAKPENSGKWNKDGIQ